MLREEQETSIAFLATYDSAQQGVGVHQETFHSANRTKTEKNTRRCEGEKKKMDCDLRNVTGDTLFQNE